MRYTRVTRYAMLLIVAILAPVFFANFVPQAHGAPTYYLTPIPFFTQEGYSITLDLVVIGALPSTTYQFVFVVRDPSGKNWTSSLQTHNTTATETQFFLPVLYPSTSFIGTGTNSLCCFYHAQVNQVRPSAQLNVASTPFDIILTDKGEYQRTEAVNIHATGYSASENVSVTIRTFTTSTLVFSQTVRATSSGTIGVVATTWTIPKNATIDSYVLTLTGTSTVKSPPDLQGFSVKPAIMSISALTSLRSTYQRTETMRFSFQPVYPDGSVASTGVALLSLARPSGTNITLTAAYNSTTTNFSAKYKTTFNNETGTWTATLLANAYGDGYGNTGPSATLTNTPQLTPATFNIKVNATTYVAIGQQVKFNATITYPDGTALQSGAVGAYLLYSGTPIVNDTFPPLVFDTGLRVWIGSYTPQSADPGGLWSLVIRASDSPVPPNTGSATKAVTLQDRPPVASFSSSTSSAPTGTSISFSGTASYDPDGTVVIYAWTFGDGTTGSGATVNHSYNTAAIYTVTLTVTDNGGLAASASSQLTITDRPPTLSFNPSPSSASTGQLITLSIITSDPDGTISTIRVDWGDGTVDTLAGTATSDSHSYSSTGSTTSMTYTVAVVATDNVGLPTSTSAQITVTDKLPVVTFLPSSTTATVGQIVTVSITSSDPDGTVSTTRVDWGDGTVDTLSGSPSSDRHSYALTGSATSKTYIITVTVTDNSGSTASNTSTLTVQAASSSPSGNLSFPLYFFGILAAIIAALAFLAFRRHRVTHAKLKIDLEAVRSEAGRIENQEFFQSVKDQLKKDKDD